MRLLSLSALLFLTGCTTALTFEGRNLTQVKNEDINTMRECHNLGEVYGSSFGGWMLRGAGQDYAKNQAMNEAVTRQATHIVWTLTEGTPLGSKAYGVAYKCPKVADN